MSSYYSLAVNPKTGKSESAFYHDDHYGPHRYGVQFSDGSWYRRDELDVLPDCDNKGTEYVEIKPGD